jgi:MFS family permease
LNEKEGLSFTQIGSFVPTFGVVYIISTFIMGLIGDKFSHKGFLFIGACIIGGAHVLVVTGEYALMVTGFGLIGIGYSTWTVVPYVQIKLYCRRNKPQYDKWYLAVELAFVCSFSFGRLMMMTTVSFLDNDDWSWRLPWIVSASMMGLHALLILLFGSFSKPISHDQDDASGNKTPRYQYWDKVRALYANPVSAMMLLASMFAAFATYALAAWAPTFAEQRFPDKDTAEINVTISIAVLTAWPVGLIVTASMLKLAKHIKNAVRISFAFVTVSAVMMLGYAVFTDSFLLHIGALVLFAASGNFASVFYKQLPDVLGFPAEVKIFALSRFTLVYSMFGDIAGWQVTGILLDQSSVSTTVWVLFIVTLGSVLFWGIPTVWSFADSGIIHDRQLEQQEEDAEHAKALRNWSLLSSYVYKKSTVATTVRSFLFPGQGSNILGRLFARDEAGGSRNVEMTSSQANLTQ